MPAKDSGWHLHVLSEREPRVTRGEESRPLRAGDGSLETRAAEIRTPRGKQWAARSSE
jgi:hypothetical protein